VLETHLANVNNIEFGVAVCHVVPSLGRASVIDALPAN
jgi:hypothetical protein